MVEMNRAVLAETLHVSESSDSYRVIIDSLRDRYRKPESYVVPLSADEKDDVYFNILEQRNQLEDILIIEEGGRSIRVTISLLDLYVIGFKTHIGTSWIFKNDEYKDIEADNRMPIFADYDSLRHPGTIPIGFQPLCNAVFLLSREVQANANWKRERARHLSTLVQMFSEAIRFNPVKNSIVNKWSTELGFYLEESNRKLLNDWVTGTGRVYLNGDRLINHFKRKKKGGSLRKKGSSSPSNDNSIIKSISDIKKLANSHSLLKCRGKITT